MTRLPCRRMICSCYNKMLQPVTLTQEQQETERKSITFCYNSSFYSNVRACPACGSPMYYGYCQPCLQERLASNTRREL